MVAKGPNLKIVTKEVVISFHNKYGTIQELRSTFIYTKSISFDFSLV